MSDACGHIWKYPPACPNCGSQLEHYKFNEHDDDISAPINRKLHVSRAITCGMLAFR